MLLRVFFLGALTREEAHTFLVKEQLRASQDHDAYEDIKEKIDWGDDMISVNGRIALEFGLRLSAMREEWAQWAADQLTVPS
jgi:hypothetical protein